MNFSLYEAKTQNISYLYLMSSRYYASKISLGEAPDYCILRKVRTSPFIKDF